MASAVVTGASGFVGSQLVCELTKMGIEVFSVCRGKNGIEQMNGTSVFNVSCKMEQYSELPGLICKSLKENMAEPPFAFYHLAWDGVLREDKDNCEKQLRNIEYTASAVRACREIGCEKYIHVGTVAEYTQCHALIDERFAPTPSDVYGATKVAARYVAAQIANTLCQDILFTILASTYGKHRRDDNIISYTTKTLLRGEKPIYGSLKQIWDFIYVEDAARALALIGLHGKPNATYGVGSGRYMSLRTYVECIRDMINPSLLLGIGEQKEKYNKVLNSCVDLFTVQRDTGFYPQYSFEQGIRKMIEGDVVGGE